MWVFVYILLVHWFSDFVLQTRHMATRKSESSYYLNLHVTIYSFSTIVLWVLFFLIVGIPMTTLTVFLSLGVTYVTHWLTDYITSRQTSKFYKSEDYKSFFDMVGFDQWIHAFTLFLTYNYIILN
jgi:hypothetical protein